MQAEICPIQGVFCRTTYADMHITRDNFFIPMEILMTQTVETNTLAKFIPVSHFIDQLRAAIRSLESYKTHPSQATLIGVAADQVQSFEVVLARVESKQRNLENDVAASAATETAATRAALARLKPVATKAKSGELSAEELLSALNSEPDARVARAQFMSMKFDNITVRDEMEVLSSSNAAALPKKYAASKVYALKVRVTKAEKESDKVDLLIIDKVLPAPLFSNTEGTLRKIITQITDLGTLHLLNLCMAYDLTVTTELAVTVDLGSNGLAYTATLIRLPHREETLREVKQAMAADMTDLFNF